MITLNQYIEELLKLKNKGFGELPVIFSIEGNAFHKVEILPSEYRVMDLEDYYLEPDFNNEETYNELEFIPNCVIIN